MISFVGFALDDIDFINWVVYGDEGAGEQPSSVFLEASGSVLPDDTQSSISLEEDFLDESADFLEMLDRGSPEAADTGNNALLSLYLDVLEAEVTEEREKSFALRCALAEAQFSIERLTDERSDIEALSQETEKAASRRIAQLVELLEGSCHVEQMLRADLEHALVAQSCQEAKHAAEVRSLKAKLEAAEEDRVQLKAACSTTESKMVQKLEGALSQEEAQAAWASMKGHINNLQHQLCKAAEERQELRKEVVTGLSKQLVTNVTFRLLQREQASELHKVREELSAKLRRSRSWQEVFALKLQTDKKQLTTLRKDLADLCTCPVSFKLMQQPMLGSDLRTYEKDAIEEALRRRPVSPFTRAPMEKFNLRPNKLAADLLELLAKHFPVLEVGFELVQAIASRNGREAVELLDRDVNDIFLNTEHRISGLDERMSLLQLSIYLRLPEVAAALIWKQPIWLL